MPCTYSFLLFAQWDGVWIKPGTWGVQRRLRFRSVCIFGDSSDIGGGLVTKISHSNYLYLSFFQSSRAQVSRSRLKVPGNRRLLFEAGFCRKRRKVSALCSTWGTDIARGLMGPCLLYVYHPLCVTCTDESSKKRSAC